MTYEFNILINNLEQACTRPLPGDYGHTRMMPQPVNGPPVDRAMPSDTCNDASVLLLLYPHQSRGTTELHFVLMRRPDYPGVHGGQISLPGGKRECGESRRRTALREAHEEVGINPRGVHVLGQLSSLYINRSGFCLFPFLAYSDVRPNFRRDPVEVAEIIEVPLSMFLDPLTQRREVWYLSHYGDVWVPFFNIHGHKVWGATAMVLSEFLFLLEAELIPT